MFVKGRVYRRRDLHRMYGGQRQGGISTPARHNIILLFTGEMGRPYGYEDTWTDEGVFLYTGDGQSGDMSFVRGNRAVRDHTKNGKDLHLLEYVSRGYVRYLGQMVCTGFLRSPGFDIDGKERQLIVFELAALDAFADDPGIGPEERDFWRDSLAVLRERAIASSAGARSTQERLTLVQSRSAAVRDYVLRRSNGVCEGCRNDAPFRTAAGRPYLEAHHIRRLTDGGPDEPQWVAALCPNCHRRAHYGQDRVVFRAELEETVRAAEKAVLRGEGE